MNKLQVLNWEGNKISDIEIKDTFFKEKLNPSLLQEVVVWQLARRRQGDHKVKTRAEVSGGGKKPFRQKGTGNARQGSIRSPLLKGGGVIHGPKKRSYDWALPKKIRQKALKNAMSYLFQNNKVFFIDNMRSTNGKTKELFNRFKKLGWDKALLIDQNTLLEDTSDKNNLNKNTKANINDSPKNNNTTNKITNTSNNKNQSTNLKTSNPFQRACKNLKNFKYLKVDGLNVYDLLKFDHLVLSPPVIKTIYKKCGIN